MRFDHLIGTIKETITEGRGGMGIASRPTPPTSTPLAKPAAPTPRPAAPPPPTGGATFGGGMVKPNSGPTAADKLKAVNSGQHQSAPRVDGMQNRTSTAAAQTAVRTNMASDARTASSRVRAKQALNSVAPAVVSNAQKQQSVASSTQTKPAVTSAPKPTPLQKASASAQAQRTKPTQVKRPVAKSKPMARPMKRPTRTTAADDFNNNMQRAMGNLEEHRTLIETVKKLARKKNSKCDTEEGDNPKGAPDGFELNPTINSSIQNR